jgi:hypothetical protein
MKELESPWVHWEGNTQTPGVQELMARFPELGRHGDGVDLESSVTQGNEEFTEKRIELLKGKGVAELLRPLFCTLDLNLQSIGSPNPGDPSDSGVNFLRTDLFVDPTWSVFSGLEVKPEDYAALVAANGQRIVDAQRKQLSGKSGAVTDTFFAFTYPSRVFSNLDAIYNRKIVEKGVVDDDFVHDVVHIDFTRPIFSETRCALLDAAPKLEAAKMTPAAIRDGFKKGLAGKSGAAAQLLANLEATNDKDAHQADVEKFFAACKARPQKEMLADAMTYASQLRNRFRELGISEFSEALTFDDVPDGKKSFDPKTCTLK